MTLQYTEHHDNRQATFSAMSWDGIGLFVHDLDADTKPGWQARVSTRAAAGGMSCQPAAAMRDAIRADPHSAA